MTKAAFLDYWTTWLQRVDPNLTLQRDGDVLRMVRADGTTFEGWPQECSCDDDQCLGWLMVTTVHGPGAGRTVS